MLLKIYAQPLWQVILEIPLCMLVWMCLRVSPGTQKPKLWRILNLCLLAVSVFSVVLMTLLRRNSGEYGLILIPGYFLQEAKIQREIYRAMLMNVLLFTPFGLALSAVLSSKMKPWRCVGLTVLIAFGFSLAVETVQYFFALGRAEADDLLANTFGAFIGALHVPLAGAVINRIARRNE